MEYIQRTITVTISHLELTREEYDKWLHITTNFRAIDKLHHCFYCGIKTKPKERTKDHLFARSLNPIHANEPIRLVVNCCVPCNRKKGRLLPDGFRIKLYSQPIEFYGEQLVRSLGY
jgi:5-methylcytosine-specific restriction endonuclease McrA